MKSVPTREHISIDPLAHYSPWFYAAAIYNLIWGLCNVLFPDLMFKLIKTAPAKDRALWQCIGMFVLVYAPAYWWAGKHPARHKHLIAVGFLGKILGPVGFIWAAARGQMPFVFGLINLTNDLIWLPSFALFLRDAAKQSGGWLAFLKGE